MAVYDRLDELADESLPVKYPRAYMGIPVGDDNPLNGWAWKCSVPRADEGPLAGRTVALKDTISLTGVPMMNGSPIMEGFVPRECLGGPRLLDASAHITGKTAVPAFCFDGVAVPAIRNRNRLTLMIMIGWLVYPPTAAPWW